MKLHKYGMAHRPLSMGAQPADIENWQDGSDGYWNFVYYKRELTEKEVSDYELTALGTVEFKNGVMV